MKKDNGPFYIGKEFQAETIVAVIQTGAFFLLGWGLVKTLLPIFVGPEFGARQYLQILLILLIALPLVGLIIAWVIIPTTRSVRWVQKKLGAEELTLEEWDELEEAKKEREDHRRRSG